MMMRLWDGRGVLVAPLIDYNQSESFKVGGLKRGKFCTVQRNITIALVVKVVVKRYKKRKLNK